MLAVVACSTPAPPPTPTPVAQVIRQTFDLQGSPKMFQHMDVPVASEVTLSVEVTQEETPDHICAVPSIWDANGNRLGAPDPRSRSTTGATYEHTFTVDAPGRISLDLHNADCDTFGVSASAQVSWSIVPR